MKLKPTPLSIKENKKKNYEWKSLSTPINPNEYLNIMSEPKEYDLTNKDELTRLLREVESYMRVSLNYGTDREGRKFALQALVRINDGRFNVQINPSHPSVQESDFQPKP